MSGACLKCGTWRERLQTDHIVPRSRGGSDDPSNLQYLCANCHEDKTRAEIRDLHRGRKHSAEHVSKIAAANSCKVRAPEQRARISAAAKQRAIRMGSDHYRKMREARDGQPWSAARRARYDAKKAASDRGVA